MIALESVKVNVKNNTDFVYFLFVSSKGNFLLTSRMLFQSSEYEEKQTDLMTKNVKLALGNCLLLNCIS